MKKILTLLLTLATSIQLFANAEIVVYKSDTGTTVGSDFVLSKENVNSFVEAGDKIVVTVSDYTLDGENYPYWQIGWDTWNGMDGVTIANGDVEVPLTEADVTNLNSKDIQFRTKGSSSYKITKIVVKKNDSYAGLEDLTIDEDTGADWIKTKIYSGSLANVSDGDIIVVQTTSDTNTSGSWHIQNLSKWSDYSNATGSFNGRDFAYIVQSTVGSTMHTDGLAICGSNDVKVSKVYLAKKIYSLNETETPNFSSILQSSPINVKLTRTFKSGWNTICLPFTLSSDNITTFFGANAEAYEYTSRSSSTLTLTKVSEMTAGKPYMLNLDAATSSITFTNVSVTATTAGTGTTNGDLTFTGNFTASMSMNGNYGLVNGSPSSIKKGGSSSTLPAFAAYFTGTPSLNAPSRGFSIEVGDGTTGIDAMERVVEEDNGPTYNLMGQQTTTPRKGIYIKNGKKYIAK